MKLYHFARLIKKYSVDFCLHKTQGRFVGGKWEQGGEAVTKMRGAIVPMGEQKIYSSGGVYTTQDRELYLETPIKGDLSDLKVVYNQNTYTIENGRNFEEYADVAVYYLKWVSKAVDEHD